MQIYSYVQNPTLIWRDRRGFQDCPDAATGCAYRFYHQGCIPVIEQCHVIGNDLTVSHIAKQNVRFLKQSEATWVHKLPTAIN